MHFDHLNATEENTKKDKRVSGLKKLNQPTQTNQPTTTEPTHINASLTNDVYVNCGSSAG